MNNENDSRFLGLVGKTIEYAHLSNSHGDCLHFLFSDGTRLDVMTYKGTSREKGHGDEELYVSINGYEI